MRLGTTSAPSVPQARPSALGLRHDVADQCCAEAGRRSSCRSEQGALTTTDRLTLEKSDTQHLLILRFLCAYFSLVTFFACHVRFILTHARDYLSRFYLK